MGDLITAQTLARWTQNEPDEVEADPFAADLIDKLSQYVCWLGGHPQWDLNPGENRVPIDVEMMVLKVAKRSYENPGRVIQEGAIGPIGGDRVADEQAMFLDLDENEMAVATRYNLAGDPTGADSSNVFVLSTTRGDDFLPQVQYVGDNQQIGLNLSADPREWKVPLFNPGDPGDPSNY